MVNLAVFVMLVNSFIISMALVMQSRGSNVTVKPWDEIAWQRGNPLEVGDVVVFFYPIKMNNHFIVVGIGKKHTTHKVTDDERYFMIF